MPSRKPSTTRPKPPSHLKAAGARLWADLASEYSIDDAGGLALLTTACECVDRMRAAQASIAKDGELVTDRYGAPKLNPACGLEKDARAGFIVAMRALRLDVEPPKPPGRPPGSWSTTR